MIVRIEVYFRDEEGDPVTVEEWVDEITYKPRLRGTPSFVLYTQKLLNQLMEEIEDGFIVEIKKERIDQDMLMLSRARAARKKRGRDIRLSPSRTERLLKHKGDRYETWKDAIEMERRRPRVRVPLDSDKRGKGSDSL